MEKPLFNAVFLVLCKNYARNKLNCAHYNWKNFPCQVKICHALSKEQRPSRIA
jgi:hypothetical protein